MSAARSVLLLSLRRGGPRCVGRRPASTRDLGGCIVEGAFAVPGAPARTLHRGGGERLR